MITIPTIIVLVVLAEAFFRFVIPASSSPASFNDEKTGIFAFHPKAGDGMVFSGKNPQAQR